MFVEQVFDQLAGGRRVDSGAVRAQYGHAHSGDPVLTWVSSCAHTGVVPAVGVGHDERTLEVEDQYLCEACDAPLDYDMSLCDECFRVMPVDRMVSVSDIRELRREVAA